jgi:hypothetical protein
LPASPKRRRLTICATQRNRVFPDAVLFSSRLRRFSNNQKYCRRRFQKIQSKLPAPFSKNQTPAFLAAPPQFRKISRRFVETRSSF